MAGVYVGILATYVPARMFPLILKYFSVDLIRVLSMHLYTLLIVNEHILIISYRVMALVNVQKMVFGL